MPEDTECLVHRLIGGDTEAVKTILAAAPASLRRADPAVSWGHP